MGFECLRLVTDLSPYSIQLLLSFLFVVLGMEPRALQCARQVLYHGATIPSTAWFCKKMFSKAGHGWHTPLIPARGRWRQAGQEFKAIVSYMKKPCPKQTVL